MQERSAEQQEDEQDSEDEGKEEGYPMVSNGAAAHVWAVFGMDRASARGQCLQHFGTQTIAHTSSTQKNPVIETDSTGQFFISH